jgi:hypothetical protein
MLLTIMVQQAHNIQVRVRRYRMDYAHVEVN